MARLTVLRAKGLIKPRRYGDGDGLWFQVRGPDQRSWLFRWKVDGRDHWMGLGPYPDVGLSEARDAARECRAQLRQGIDPLAAKRSARSARRPAAVTTFQQAAESYLAAHASSWKNAKHRDQWSSTLEAHAYPTIGGKPVDAVDTDAVMAVLRPIWHTTPETASRVRGRIEAILDYARVSGWRSADNPARWKGHLDHLLPAREKVRKTRHHPALPWQQMSDFWPALAAQPGMSAITLRFAILTATRTNEVLEATWSEVDIAAAVWSIPGRRMKADRPHRIPLSAAALAILADVAHGNTGPDAPLFSGHKPGQVMSNMALLMQLRRMNPHTDAAPARWRDAVSGQPIVPHGFRSTFRDWVLEATEHAADLAEISLAHVVKDKTEAAYKRGEALDRRRALMEDWARFCGGG